MYRKTDGQMHIHNFIHPFGGNLDKDNRWVKMAEIIPWEKIEEEYASLFTDNIGNIAKPARMALGALIIQEKLGLTDRETVEQIKENLYLQYFIGLKEFQKKAPFDYSLMPHFRKRFAVESMQDINELICLGDKEDDEEPPSPGGTPGDEHENKGKVILDGSCVPADIRYPTDLSLLNEARQKLESIIDTLYEPLQGETKKPRTYRIKARKEYLKIAKQRQPKRKAIRKAVGKQLRFIARNLGHIERLEQASPAVLSISQQEQLPVIRRLYQQQQYMYEHKTNKVEDRIVSISQPHVRPIVRGKVGTPTEFGAKVAISLVNNDVFLEKISWNNFNEGSTLIASAEEYKRRFGYYPEAIIADIIYRNRKNLRYCKEKGIRLSGPRLGRPPLEVDEAKRKLEREDARIRNSIEGKLGVGKRRYSLGLIKARLQETSEAVIALQFLVMNLERRLRIIFYLFFQRTITEKTWRSVLITA